LQSEMEITEQDHFVSLSEKLADQGAKEIIRSLEMFESEQARYYKQDHDKATFSNKIFKEDMFIDWKKSAGEIRNLVRGLADKPAATAAFRNKRIKIIEVELVEKDQTDREPGTILEVIKNTGILVSAVGKNIIIKQVQPAGKKIMNAFAFNLGARISEGEKFENGF